MKNKSFLLFLAAALSQTQIQIVGYIGISELAMLFIGPFLIYKNWDLLKRDGFGTVIVLAGLWAASAIATDLYRGTYTSSMLKGVAAPLSVMMMVPCFYLLLRDDIRRMKWAILGFCVTTFLSIYVVQTGVTTMVAQLSGITAKEAALQYKLANMSLILNVAFLVPMLGYLRMPMVAVLVTFAAAVVALLEGGRSSFMSTLLSCVMLVFALGNKSQIRYITRRTLLLLLVMIATVLVSKLGYKYAAESGWMGDVELKKYEQQSASRIGLMSGRYEFLAVALAVRDSPILGHGSWALDYVGYDEHAREIVGEEAAPASTGIGYIPSHSHIMCAYVWHGILGAVFWIYVLGVLWHVFRHDMGVVPELYGWLAVMLPSMLWNILFSPFGERVIKVCAIVVFLLLKQMHRQSQLAVRARAGEW